MKKTGWLILDYNLKPLEFLVEEQPSEPPYSDDEGIWQFHLEIDFSTEYPTAKVID
jgi:hypothetical protein